MAGFAKLLIEGVLKAKKGHINLLERAKAAAEKQAYGENGKTGKLLTSEKKKTVPKMAVNLLNTRKAVSGNSEKLG